MRNSNWLFLCLLAYALPSPIRAQILQDRPELCGNALVAIPLPPGVSAISNVVGLADLTIKLRDGSLKTMETDADEIRQVCPLDRDRLLLFGPVAGGDGYMVWILSQIDGAILDILGARNPVVSPDQHWLVYRERYPTRSEVVWEQYLLYDLTKDAAHNARPSGTPQWDVGGAGRMIFPVTANRARLHGFVVAPDQRHEFASESFFWSPDSRFIAFGNRVKRTTSVVIIDVGQGEPTAFVHPISASEICSGDEFGSRTLNGAIVSRVEFGVERDTLPSIWAHFSLDAIDPRTKAACAKVPHLHSGNLRRAGVELHKELK